MRFFRRSGSGFSSWSSSDSGLCRLRWCPGLLGVSAFRLLCFPLPLHPPPPSSPSPPHPNGRWPLCCGAHPILSLLFLHRASAFCHNSELNLPPNPAPPLFLSDSPLFFMSTENPLYLSHLSKCQILPDFLSFSHSFANSEACKTSENQSLNWKLGGCGIPVSFNIHL